MCRPLCSSAKTSHFFFLRSSKPTADKNTNTRRHPQHPFPILRDFSPYNYRPIDHTQMLNRTEKNDDRSLWAKCPVHMITGANRRGMMTPLSGIADAFEDIARLIQSRKAGEEDLTLERFCEACSLVSVLFGCLGLAFKFAELEYVAKLRDLIEASRSHNKLLDILDIDITSDTVKTQGSHTRNLRRVRQGLDLIRTIFESFVSSNDNSLKEAATMAYAKVCAPYHTWAVRTAVYAGMYTLPTRDQLLQKLNETDQTADKKMRRYIKASAPVIEYIDSLYVSRKISLDW